MNDIISELKAKIKEYEDKLDALKKTLAIYDTEKTEQKTIQKKKEAKKVKKPVAKKKISNPKRSKRKQKTKVQAAEEILNAVGKPMTTSDIYKMLKDVGYPFSQNSTDKMNQANLYTALRKNSSFKLVKPGIWDLK